MRWLVKAIATVGGIGYVPKAPGTAGSLAGLLLGIVMAGPKPLRDVQPTELISLLGCTLVGVAVSGRAERDFGTRDPSQVVIDEFCGMWAVLAVAPFLRYSLALVAMAFGLFRLFDITKPPPLKLLERLPGGWGMMLDDLGAAAYTVVVLWVACLLIRMPR